MKPYWQEMKNGLVLTVKVSAGAGRQLLQVKDGYLKVYLKAPREKGKANEELISLLSKQLALPKTNLGIISGHSSTLKRVKVVGANAERIAEALRVGESSG